MKRLVVDDVRNPNFEARVERFAKKALHLIRTEPWDEVWLDHDADFVASPDYTYITNSLYNDALLGKTYDVGLFVLHSANTGGRERMMRVLERHYRVVDIEKYRDKTLRLASQTMVVDVSTRHGVESPYVYWPETRWRLET